MVGDVMVGNNFIMGRTQKVVVCGARGCGKTSILEKVIYDNNGVRIKILVIIQYTGINLLFVAALFCHS